MSIRSFTSNRAAQSTGRDGASTHRVSAVAIALAALPFTLLTVSLAAAGPMYKWVDEKGQVIFSDQPPPPDVKAEVVKPPPPPANPNAVKEMVDAQAEIKARDRQKQEEAAKAEKKRADDAKRRDMCEKAQGQIRSLQRQDLVRINPKGDPIYLDAETRRKETEEQQALIQANCKS